ncbi:hypothetical protein B9Z55_027142 [Caenorhabditis nigoni]|nr:hypothetical protein B9Z55_027142 [Caenorhabditis nigoni]
MGRSPRATVKITASDYANILLDGQEPEDCHQLIAYEIEQSWRTENIGIEDILTAENNKKSTQDLLEQFNKTVRYDKDGHSKSLSHTTETSQGYRTTTP